MKLQAYFHLKSKNKPVLYFCKKILRNFKKKYVLSNEKQLFLIGRALIARAKQNLSKRSPRPELLGLRQRVRRYILIRAIYLQNILKSDF
jgi:hypothetical protein